MDKQLTKKDAAEIRRLATLGHKSIDQVTSPELALRNLCLVALFLIVRCTEDTAQ